MKDLICWLFGSAILLFLVVAFKGGGLLFPACIPIVAGYFFILYRKGASPKKLSRGVLLLTKPLETAIHRITEESKRIASGDVQMEVPAVGPTEFCLLADQLNEMSKKQLPS
ncbi:HAMP domain-containing protein [Brevibacillus sp. SYP-B805]|uniref:HAMP domain-containing protein n=1 Tax=Brevibacillus sp. SYP-B805 TaxID=1578199 RepID=UPI0013EA3D31|nr:HAMP domain-containing protein [Brevibacillus sp. SYP-B805]